MPEQDNMANDRVYVCLPAVKRVLCECVCASVKFHRI